MVNIYYCDVIYQFLNFEKSNRGEWYQRLFKILIPYELDIKIIKLTN